MEAVTIIPEEMKRTGFRFTRDVIRATIPSGVVGTYCLIADAEPIYIGRSDHCVLTRLAGHPLTGQATHFVWEPSRCTWQAFCLESFWWHRIEQYPSLRNAIHPARPAGVTRPCPFCEKRDAKSLRRMLPWLAADSATPTKSFTQTTTCSPS